ncbi:MAG: hypothetical protein KatS3mg124_0980 [Porticoccaceae bacterium]|nr:MAG: hypothetical protein KatS3mg124_0980 [Porticoccaceae bacterium]
MIFSSEDLRVYVVRDTLRYLDDWTRSAENLLVGTAIQESGLGFSLREGHRYGLYHLSPAEHRAVWDHYLVADPELASRVRGLAGQRSFVENPHRELVTNLRYATAIAWCIYRRAGAPLPPPEDLEGLALYWHRHFRRRPSGTPAQFVRNYRELARPRTAGAA